jgi:hypothetical protein
MGQSNAWVRILEQCFARMVELLPDVTEETWLLVQEKVVQAAQHGRDSIDP